MLNYLKAQIQHYIQFFHLWYHYYLKKWNKLLHSNETLRVSFWLTWVYCSLTLADIIWHLSQQRDTAYAALSLELRRHAITSQEIVWQQDTKKQKCKSKLAHLCILPKASQIPLLLSNHLFQQENHTSKPHGPAVILEIYTSHCHLTIGFKSCFFGEGDRDRDRIIT